LNIKLNAAQKTIQKILGIHCPNKPFFFNGLITGDVGDLIFFRRNGGNPLEFCFYVGIANTTPRKIVEINAV